MDLPSKQPGYFQIFISRTVGDWYLLYNCPCGCGDTEILPLELKGENTWHRTGWLWDGDLERPTFTPSFKRHGSACKVHFNVEKGCYIIHADGAPAASNCYRAPDG